MRARALSNEKVISLLNGFFVPVYAGGKVWRDRVGEEEENQKKRIISEANRKGLSAGAVHAYVLEPTEGRVVDSLHVVKAADPAKLVPMLEKAVRELQTKAGTTLVAPKLQLPAPAAPADALRLHLTARSLPRDAEDLEDPDFKGRPAESWIVLSRDEWTKLLPAGEVAVGRSWPLAPEVAANILRWFFPFTESHKPEKDEIREQELTATAVSIEAGLVRARLEGRLSLLHRNFFSKGVRETPVEGKLRGLLEYRVGGPGVPTLKLVTDGATYGGRPLGVAVRSVPSEGSR